MNVNDHLREQLQKVYDQHGRLDPELVVQVATPKRHPLHRFVFDKPQREAAAQYYRDRAHELISSVRVVYREADEEGPAKSLRYFHAVQSGGPNSFVYEPLDKVAEDDFTRQLVLRNAERQWKELFRRYSDLEEFLSLVEGDVKERKAA